MFFPHDHPQDAETFSPESRYHPRACHDGSPPIAGRWRWRSRSYEIHTSANTDLGPGWHPPSYQFPTKDEVLSMGPQSWKYPDLRWQSSTRHATCLFDYSSICWARTSQPFKFDMLDLTSSMPNHMGTAAINRTKGTKYEHVEWQRLPNISKLLEIIIFWV